VNELLIVCYGTLLLFTVAIAVLSIANFRRCGGLEHLFIGAGLYYYSLYGAWTVLAVKRGLEASEALDHLEASLFRVSIDDDYLLALLLYGLFVVSILAGIGLLCRQRWFDEECTMPMERMPSLRRLLAICLVALVASAAALFGEIRAAIEQGVPLYLFTRTEVSGWFTVHQLCNRVGLITLACAWPIQMRRPTGSKFLTGSCLVVLTLVWLGYLGALGNRNEIAVAIVACFLLFLRLGARIRWGKLAVSVFFVYLALRSIETFRAVPPAELFDRVLEALVDPKFWNPASLAGGSESLAAHVSMYGIISTPVSWTWGESAIYFLQSLLPFIPGVDRVPDSYSVYAAAVGAPAGQGFNIHFAAGAYLNFGPLAVVAAGGVIALVFAGVRALARWSARETKLVMPTMLAYCYFCALLPVNMRAGPESLKALLFEGFLIPFLVVLVAAIGRGTASASALPAAARGV